MRRYSKALLSDDEVREILQVSVYAAGGRQAWAQRHHMSEEYVRAVLTGRRPPAKKITDVLKLERFQRWVWK